MRAVLADTLAWIVGRLLRTLTLIIAVLLGSFLLLRLAPGDPALSMAGAQGIDDPLQVQSLRRQMGLEQPLSQQLVHYLRGLMRLDLGYSHHHQSAVWTLIAERLPASILLGLSAWLTSAAGGITLGVMAAWSHRHQRHLDRLIRAATLLLYAVPAFWLGLLLVLLFSVHWTLLPAYGMESVGGGLSGWERALDIARHLLLPGASLSFIFLAIYVQLTRASILEAYAQDYVRGIRAKGARGAQVLLRHVLPNALPPVTSYAGLQLGQLASASLLVEVVYAWPGIGRLMYESIAARDYPLLLGVFLVVSVLVLLGNLLGELGCWWLDPRQRGRAKR